MTDRHNGCGGPKTPQVYEFPPTPLSIAPCSNAKPDTPYTPFNDQEGEEDFSSCLPIPVDTIEIDNAQYPGQITVPELEFIPAGSHDWNFDLTDECSQRALWNIASASNNPTIGGEKVVKDQIEDLVNNSKEVRQIMDYLKAGNTIQDHDGYEFKAYLPPTFNYAIAAHPKLKEIFKVESKLSSRKTKDGKDVIHLKDPYGNTYSTAEGLRCPRAKSEGRGKCNGRIDSHPTGKEFYYLKVEHNCPPPSIPRLNNFIPSCE